MTTQTLKIQHGSSSRAYEINTHEPIEVDLDMLTEIDEYNLQERTSMTFLNTSIDKPSLLIFRDGEMMFIAKIVGTILQTA